MNWAAIGAVGEILGAAAVVATLVYVSRQIRDQNKALQTTTRDSAFHQLQQWNYVVMADPRLSAIFHKGAQSADWSDLEEDERARFVHVMYSFYKLFENIYLHSLDGSITPDVWERNKAIFVAYASQAGCERFLAHRRPTFDPRFLAFIDTMGGSSMPPGGELTSLS